MKPTALITGSSRGLGKQLALTFARNGHPIILHGRDIRALEEVKNQIKVFDVDCVIVKGDLRSHKTMSELKNVFWGRGASILINNAGISYPGWNFVKGIEIENCIATNSLAPIMLTKILYKSLKEKKGTIVYINSLSGLEVQEARPVYCASKWGLRGFVDSFRGIAHDDGVRVINIYPQRIKTKQHYTEGIDPEGAAKAIYQCYADKKFNGDLKL